ncbi:MAG: hypothetical protein NVSMB33_06880 [Ktedonobacteraceae bacterium]
MNAIADELVSIQTSSESAPSMPSWFGEVALIFPIDGTREAAPGLSTLRS